MAVSMDWSNVAFLLLGFLVGAVVMGYLNYLGGERLFRSIARSQEAHNEMVRQSLEILEKRGGE